MNESAVTLWRDRSLLLSCCVTLAKSPVHSVPQSPLMHEVAGHQLYRHSYSLLLIFQKASKSTSSSSAVSSGAVTYVPGPATTPRTRHGWSGPNCLSFNFFTYKFLAATVFFLRSL